MEALDLPSSTVVVICGDDDRCGFRGSGCADSLPNGMAGLAQKAAMPSESLQSTSSLGLSSMFHMGNRTGDGSSPTGG